MKMYSPFLNQ